MADDNNTQPASFVPHTRCAGSTRTIILPKSTPFPNFFLDKVMPIVSPSVWKVLCFLWRKTVGWDKQIDLLSLSQLTKGAGVCKDTVLRAVAFWEDVGLISRKARSGYRGTSLYAVNFTYDPSLVLNNLERLVKNNDRSDHQRLLGRIHPPPIVRSVDTQKALIEKQSITKAHVHTLSKGKRLSSFRNNYQPKETVYAKP
jgi:hypothetical protein